MIVAYSGRSDMYMIMTVFGDLGVVQNSAGHGFMRWWSRGGAMSWTDRP